MDQNGRRDLSCFVEDLTLAHCLAEAKVVVENFFYEGKSAIKNRDRPYLALFINEIPNMLRRVVHYEEGYFDQQSFPGDDSVWIPGKTKDVSGEYLDSFREGLLEFYRSLDTAGLEICIRKKDNL